MPGLNRFAPVCALALVACFTLAAPLAPPAHAETEPAAQAEAAPAALRLPPPWERIAIVYGAPGNESHTRIDAVLRSQRVLEQVREFLAPLRLRRTIRLKLDGCDGETESSYDPEDQTVLICFGYVEDVIRLANRAENGQDLTFDDFVVGPTVEAILHEVAHAIFDQFNLPILGREEDAADQFAAFAMLELGKERARTMIAATAHMYRQEAQSAASAPSMRQFAGIHSLPAQRYYNLLCIAYGSDPDKYADLVQNADFPPFRLNNCADEYKQVKRAFEALIAPHLDGPPAGREAEAPALGSSIETPSAKR